MVTHFGVHWLVPLDRPLCLSEALLFVSLCNFPPLQIFTEWSFICCFSDSSNFCRGKSSLEIFTLFKFRQSEVSSVVFHTLHFSAE